MKRKFLFVFIFSLLCCSVTTAQKASDEKIGLTLTPYTGLSVGQLDEAIYSSYGYRCSLLEWQKMPLSIWGINIKPSFYNFNIELDGNIALPFKCGHMYDSDWNGDGIKHTYSINDCYAKLNTCLNLSLSYDFNFQEKYTLSPVLNLQYDFNQLESRNGYGWYGASWATGLSEDVSWDDFRARKAKLYGVDFYRHTLITFFGPAFTWQPSKKLTLSLQTLVSPYIYQYTMDHHLNKTTGIYYLSIQNGFWSKYKIILNFNYQFNNRFQLYACANAVFGTEDTGKFYAEQYQNQGLALTDQNSGANLWNINIISGCSITF